PDEVRGGLQQPFALDQRLAHQGDLAVLQVAEAAVDQPGRTAGRHGDAIRLLHERHPQAAPGRVPRRPAAVDAAAHDDDVEALALAVYALAVDGAERVPDRRRAG